MPPGLIPLGVLQASPTGRRLRAHWRDYTSDLGWGCLGIAQEELEGTAREADVWSPLFNGGLGGWTLHITKRQDSQRDQYQVSVLFPKALAILTTSPLDKGSIVVTAQELILFPGHKGLSVSSIK